MDNLEDKLLKEYVDECYPGVSEDAYEVIRATLGFQIHILSYHHKELADAIRKRIHQAQDNFIKRFLGS